MLRDRMNSISCEFKQTARQTGFVLWLMMMMMRDMDMGRVCSCACNNDRSEVLLHLESAQVWSSSCAFKRLGRFREAMIRGWRVNFRGITRHCVCVHLRTGQVYNTAYKIPVSRIRQRKGRGELLWSGSIWLGGMQREGHPSNGRRTVWATTSKLGKQQRTPYIIILPPKEHGWSCGFLLLEISSCGGISHKVSDKL